MRKRFKIYDLRFTIFLFLFVLFINHQSLFINHLYAVESTPSSEIRSKLEELKREIASKAAKLKQEVNKKLKDKAYAGKVKSVSETSFTLAAHSGPKIVSINQDTGYGSQLKSKKKFSQKTIAEEDFVVALGDIDETGVLTAKKIILLPQMEESNKTSLWGKVIAISDKLITIKSRDNKNIAGSLTSGSAVKLNDFIISTGQLNKNEIFEAEFVYIIPQGGFIKPKKITTPSAKVSTPSAKPTTSSAKPKSSTR